MPTYTIQYKSGQIFSRKGNFGVLFLENERPRERDGLGMERERRRYVKMTLGRGLSKLGRVIVITIIIYRIIHIYNIMVNLLAVAYFHI